MKGSGRQAGPGQRLRGRNVVVGAGAARGAEQEGPGNWGCASGTLWV